MLGLSHGGFKWFSRLLEHLGDSELNNQLTTAQEKMGLQLQQVARDTNLPAKGSIALKLTFKADPKGVVHITPDIKVTLPQPPAPATLMWLDKNGLFTPDNPKQQRLPNIERVQGGNPELGRVPPDSPVARVGTVPASVAASADDDENDDEGDESNDQPH